ncbi:MAG: hypothetical protein HY698_12765 [Deltaproteobacteria bacterium]|nr:hypothetical protein [Deltaproteobacteria bacterium]
MRAVVHKRIARPILFLPVFLTACGSDFSSPAGHGDFGATPGGVKDMRFARELVKNGKVPPPEAFLVA